MLRFGLWRVSGIPYGTALRIPSGPALQIHTRHEGHHMVAAQHMESQVALYLIVMLPLPKDEPLSSLISSVAQLSQVTNWTWFFCSHLISFVLVRPPCCSHIAYFCVQSLANLLYLWITDFASALTATAWLEVTGNCGRENLSHSPFPVSLVCVSDFWYQRVIRIRVTKQRADGQ